MEGWPSQADRNRSDHLIFDVANAKQDPGTERAAWIPDKVLHVFQLEPFPGPFWTLLSNPFCSEWFPAHSCVGASWKLIQITQISPGTEGIIPHVPRHHHPSFLPSELFSKRQHKLISSLFGILVSPNYSISSWAGEAGKLCGRADFSSHLLCFSCSSEDEQCQVDL